jgi:adenylate cyclase
MSEGTQRRLAAIVSADVVGYSRLMGVDEAGTLAALRNHRAELIDGKIAEHGGRIVKTMGDGLLLEFPSVVDAIQCVIDVQQAMAGRNEAVDEDKRIIFRIGVHLGDLVVEGDDIFGDGINIAARLEAICEAGGVAISGTAHENIAGRIEVGFVDAGDQQLKNISRPVRVWQWTPTTSPMPRTGEALSLPDKPSIAVLPFDNMSGDPEQEYFSDGLTEDIITVLSRLRWLFVISRNSTFRYKGTASDVRQIGRDLEVRYVLEGSVRKAGSRVRITAQLIDTSNDHHLWAENYDRDLEDIFALQDDMARQISACLAPEIERAEWRGLEQVQNPNLSSWDLYLRGLARMHEYSREGNIAARDHFQQAIALEPEFADAHAALAYVIYHDINDGYVDSRSAAMREAEDCARTAMTIDDQDAFGHCVLGRIYSIQARFDDAITELQVAIRLNPSLALAYHGLAYALLFSGDAEQAIPLFETAEKLSPHDHNVWAFLSIRGIAYSQIGDYEAAARVGREAVRKPHAKFWAGVNLLSTLGHTNEKAEMQEVLDELLRQRPDVNIHFVKKSMDYFKESKHLEHFIDGLRSAGLPEE